MCKNTSNPRHFAYHHKNQEQGNPIGLIRLRVNFNDVKGDWFDLYMLQPEEVDGFIEGTGWSLERVKVAEDLANPMFGVILRNSG